MGLIIGGFAFNNFFTEVITRAWQYEYRNKKYQKKNTDKQNNFNEETI